MAGSCVALELRTVRLIPFALSLSPSDASRRCATPDSQRGSLPWHEGRAGTRQVCAFRCHGRRQAAAFCDSSECFQRWMWNLRGKLTLRLLRYPANTVGVEPCSGLCLVPGDPTSHSQRGFEAVSVVSAWLQGHWCSLEGDQRGE